MSVVNVGEYARRTGARTRLLSLWRARGLHLPACALAEAVSIALSGLAGFPRRSLPWLAAGWTAYAGLAVSAATGAYMQPWTTPWRTTSP